MKQNTYAVLMVLAGVGLALGIVALVFPFILDILVRVLS